jgi:hypothetical protein
LLAQKERTSFAKFLADNGPLGRDEPLETIEQFGKNSVGRLAFSGHSATVTARVLRVELRTIDESLVRLREVHSVHAPVLAQHPLIWVNVEDAGGLKQVLVTRESVGMIRTTTAKPSRRGLANVAVIAGIALSICTIARADDDAAAILKAMSDYVGSQKSISATFDSDIEVITRDLEKIQFASSGQVQLSRPNKIRIRRTGGYADVELIYDGKTVTLSGNNTKAYVQQEMSGSTDEMIDAVQAKLGKAMPGTDLLLTKSFDVLMADVIDGRHIGQGVIDGIDCEHLAFRNADTDWQIWVETGARPIPRKFVITSKAVAGAPQYTLRIKDWKTDALAGDEIFTFKPEADAKKIAIEAMRDFDEVPAGVPAGGKK